MKVFISWSGERSKAFALELSSWLQNVIHYIRPWISDKDMHKGTRWFQIIGEELAQSKIGFICVTPENIDSPWLLFEAGALSKEFGEARVCPILLGMLPSELTGPLSQFQATTFTKNDIFKLVKSLNNELGDEKLEYNVLEKSFEKFWPDLENRVGNIAKLGITGSSLNSVIKAFQSHGFPHPAIGRIICFKEGFESHLLYQTVFSLSKERLYIFGRKNRKIFDKEHYDFIMSLSKRLLEGFDFKCLFLNPYAPTHIIKEANEDIDFHNQLTECIDRALKVMRDNGINPDSICRVYKTYRHSALIVSDNTVLFAPIEMNTSGKARRLTKCGFKVVDSDIPLGKELMNNFLETWESAFSITSIYRE